LPQLDIGVADFEAILDLARFVDRNRAPARDADPETRAIPEDRFFATNMPLDRTRSDIERGTVRYLRELHEHSVTELRCPFVLVLYPRAYQYSSKESRGNHWESGSYDQLGPYVLEPFRYFAEVQSSLPYPLIDLMAAFVTADEFPLFFEDDPHWNAPGANLAARAVLDTLSAKRLLPATR
jgi:hypothetical protein